jgi:hypothetical protein
MPRIVRFKIPRGQLASLFVAGVTAAGGPIVRVAT